MDGVSFLALATIHPNDLHCIGSSVHCHWNSPDLPIEETFLTFLPRVQMSGRDSDSFTHCALDFSGDFRWNKVDKPKLHEVH